MNIKISETAKIRAKTVLQKKFNGSLLLAFIMLVVYNAYNYYWPNNLHPFWKLILDISVLTFCVFVNIDNPSLVKVALELIKILGNGATLEEKIEQCKAILKAVVNKYDRLWKEQPIGMKEAEEALKIKEAEDAGK